MSWLPEAISVSACALQTPNRDPELVREVEGPLDCWLEWDKLTFAYLDGQSPRPNCELIAPPAMSVYNPKRLGALPLR